MDIYHKDFKKFSSVFVIEMALQTSLRRRTGVVRKAMLTF